MKMITSLVLSLVLTRRIVTALMITLIMLLVASTIHHVHQHPLATHAAPSVVSATIAQHANLDHTARGYHLLYGNPDSSLGTDPGWRGILFNLTSDLSIGAGLLSDDGRFVGPLGISVYREVSCRMDITSVTITSMQQYASSLDQSVEASASGGIGSFSAAFSGSAEWKQANEVMSSYSSFVTKSTASCMLYTVSYWQDQLPSLSEAFDTTVVEQIKLLSDTYKITDAANAIIAAFGTHFGLTVRMGSRFGVENVVSASAAQSSNSRDIRASASLNAKFMGASGSASVSYDRSNQASTKFVQETKKTTMFSVGALPPASGNVEDWVSTSSSDPAVVQVRDLRNISILLDPSRFSSGSVDSSQLRELKEAVSARIVELLAPTGMQQLSFDNPPVMCFGGMYQREVMPASPSASFYRAPKDVSNPFTGAPTCPTGYRVLPVYSTMRSYGRGDPAQTDAPLRSLFMCVSMHESCATNFQFHSYETDSMIVASKSTNDNCWPGVLTQSCSCPTMFDTIVVHKVPLFGGRARVFEICTPTAWGSPVGGSFQLSSIPFNQNTLTITREPDTKQSLECPPLYSPFLVGVHHFVLHEDGCYREVDVHTYMCLHLLHPMLQVFSFDPQGQPEPLAPNLSCTTRAYFLIRNVAQDKCLTVVNGSWAWSQLQPCIPTSVMQRALIPLSINSVFSQIAFPSKDITCEGAETWKWCVLYIILNGNNDDTGACTTRRWREATDSVVARSSFRFDSLESGLRITFQDGGKNLGYCNGELRDNCLDRGFSIGTSNMVWALDFLGYSNAINQNVLVENVQ